MAARAAGRFGLDTEFMREKTYRPVLCLVQISAGPHIFLIDTLATDQLKAVAEAIADPAVGTIVHAGRQDLEIFYDLYGILPAGVFDVQVAAGFAGLGASLPYARVVSALCGVALEKGESYTHWDRRPLSRAQLSYAADDVRYLAEAADALVERLGELGRLEWARDEMKALTNEGSYGGDTSELWRRVAGRGSLSPRQNAVLRELTAWREELASLRDLPRSWVVKDAALVELARRAPTTLDQLRSIRGLNPKEAERSQSGLLGAIRTGLAAPPIRMDKGPSRPIAQAARTLVGLADAVIRARCDRAQMAMELVTTRSEIESLLADVLSGEVVPGRHRLLQGWRAELAGDAVVALAEGKIAVRASAKAPFVHEVPVDVEVEGGADGGG